MPMSQMDNLIHQGIKHHEAGRLEQATQLFKQASNMDSPIAMFLYGISLRHGWGCTKNEFLAFQYLQRAAEFAVEELTKVTSKVKVSAAKNELIMAIYELGVCFRHGWGVSVKPLYVSFTNFVYYSARRIKKRRFIISRLRQN